MASTIDYANYTYTDLLKARESIDEQAFPENVAELDRLIAQHQSQDVSATSVTTSAATSVATSTQPGRTGGVVFSGKAGEFFSIWIVNLLLSIVTLGIYSAWAKVRTNRYFYGNTAVDGHRFSYLAEPIQILKGRIIAVLLFVVYMLGSTFSPIAGGVLLIALLLISPWLVCKSLNFNLKMTGYRNVRFGFKGTYGPALLVFIVFPILTVFTLYLALPWALKKMDEFIVKNTTFGDKTFTTTLGTGSYFAAAFAAMGAAMVIAIVGVAIIAGSVAGGADLESEVAGAMGAVTMFFMYVLIFAISSSIYHAMIRNHIYEVSQLEGAATFRSDVSIGGLMALRVTNFLAIIFSLGLAIPWAKVRMAAYYAAHTEVTVLPGISSILASPEQTASSTADEVANAFDLDISLG